LQLAGRSTQWTRIGPFAASVTQPCFFESHWAQLATVMHWVAGTQPAQH